MKIFTRDYRMEGALPSSYMRYFGELKPCVLDIETTGLSRENSKVILVGLLTETESGIKATQFLAENHYEEHKVLTALMDFLRAENIGYLITFNGAFFDIPFLKSRLAANFMDDNLSLFDFDLYRFIKRTTDLKERIGSLKQIAVENHYGILDDRDDTITGRESVTMFDEYSLTGNSTLEKIILTHNREDIVHLYRLMHYVLGDTDANNDMDRSLAIYGFPIMQGRFSLRPCIKKSGRGSKASYMLRINGDQLWSPISAAFFPDAESPISAEFKSETGMFCIDVPVELVPESVSEDEDVYYLDTASSELDLSDNPDCVNGYLILNPGNVNLAAELICEKVIEKAGM